MNQADTAVLADESTGKSGSVATVALLHSLDAPHSLPYYSSSLLSLTIAHLGDTRAILASTSSGRAKGLTENHHPDSRIESERLRQSGTGIVTDSFGESRWGGTLANTRGIGDREFKTLGVIGEPVVQTSVLKGADCYFCFFSSLSRSHLCAENRRGLGVLNSCYRRHYRQHDGSGSRRLVSRYLRSHTSGS